MQSVWLYYLATFTRANIHVTCHSLNLMLNEIRESFFRDIIHKFNIQSTTYGNIIFKKPTTPDKKLYYYNFMLNSEI